MSTAFDQAFKVVVGEEGGYSADPRDPGNWTGGAAGQGVCKGTKYGISAAAYPNKDIANLTLDQAKAIYLTDYWRPAVCDRLPGPFALIVFDAAVNNGVHRAVPWLQIALEVPADGKWGPKSQAALDAAAGNGAKVMSEFMARRTVFMASLPNWKIEALGWARRLCSLPFNAVEMTS